MELTRNEKIQIKNMLEDRINGLHELFSDLTEDGYAGYMENSVAGVVKNIYKKVCILEKIVDDLGVTTEYDLNWMKGLIEDFEAWSKQKSELNQNIIQPQSKLKAFIGRFTKGLRRLFGTDSFSFVSR